MPPHSHLSRTQRALATFVDLREGEGPVAIGAFVVLLLVIMAHSMLETARDALFLEKLPARQLNIVYVAVAGLSLVVGPVTLSLSRRIGPRRALVVLFVAFAALLGALYATRGRPLAIYALYATSGLLGAVLIPQFWAVLARALTLSQRPRRSTRR